MASFPQSQFFSSLIPIKNKSFSFSPAPKNSLSFRNSKISSSPNTQENSPESGPDEADPVKLAFAKAKAYKNSTQSGIQTPNIVGKIEDSSTSISEVKEEVPLTVKLALEKANGYKESTIVSENEGVAYKIFLNSSMESAEIDEVKSDGDGGGKEEIPSAVKVALEKAMEYKKNKGAMDSEVLASGLKGGSEKTSGDKQSVNNSDKKSELSISSIDFMGLGFADKKSGRGLPAGLVPQSDPFPIGDLPEVEILVGDTSKFGDASVAQSTAQVKGNDADLYKPKVSTWGVFPRPSDISKTYGGGRTLRPGEALETAEERAAKQERTRQLVASYKSQIGLNIDPKLKSECEKELKDGDSLMDLGKLREALPFYEKVMEKLPAQSELHGLAALQWSICQDSLTRPNEARVMYEKLQSHPSPQVSKKARQFYFSFQAMEMMKVKSGRSRRATGYQNYFDAFVRDKTNYPLQEAEEDDEGGWNQAIPYVIFLVSPLLIVLLMAASRS